MSCAFALGDLLGFFLDLSLEEKLMYVSLPWHSIPDSIGRRISVGDRSIAWGEDELCVSLKMNMALGRRKHLRNGQLNVVKDREVIVSLILRRPGSQIWARGVPRPWRTRPFLLRRG